MRVENEVLAVLSAATTKGNALVLVGQLDRKLYERTNKVLEAAGGKWDRKAKAHVFERDAAEAMEQIILTGDVDYAKSPKSVAQLYGFFPTPPAVVARVMALADIRAGMAVLEPSAGHGALARAAFAAGASVDCVELLPDNVAKINGGGFAEAVMEGDFLAVAPTRSYDRVVMNPPFARQDDIRHVTHALRFVKPGGRLVSVMSAGVTFRDNRLTTDFRDLVGSHCVFEQVPDGAFKESGTGVRTVILSVLVP